MNRQARVRFGDSTSKARTMWQGLPQCSMLSPIPLVININNLAMLLPDSETIVMSADDVSILSTRRNREDAQAGAQAVVVIVVEWSHQWKLSLNATKSETAFFTRWNREFNLQPKIEVDGKIIPYVKNPRLLGVYLDCSLSFAEHTQIVAAAAASKTKLMQMVAYTDWGWGRTELKKIYSAFVKSKLDYGASGWQPWLATSNVRPGSKPCYESCHRTDEIVTTGRSQAGSRSPALPNPHQQNNPEVSRESSPSAQGPSNVRDVPRYQSTTSRTPMLEK